jgi:hypothetical protein
MGILFNRKGSNGVIINKKYLPAKDLYKKDIKEISSHIGIYKTAGKREFRKMLTDNKQGGVTREEMHDTLQKLIGEGYITSTSQARKIASDIGLKEKRFLKFKKLHDYLRSENQNKAAGSKIEKQPAEEKRPAHQASCSPSQSLAQRDPKEIQSAKPSRPLGQDAPVSNAPALAERLRTFRNPSTGRTASSGTDGKPKSIWSLLDRSNQ